MDFTVMTANGLCVKVGCLIFFEAPVVTRYGKFSMSED